MARTRRLPIPESRSRADELAELADVLRAAEEKKAEADAEIAAVYRRLGKMMGPSPAAFQLNAAAATAETSAVASLLPPLPRRSPGQGDRIVELLRERPGAPLGWLAEQVYGKDTASNRQSLGSMLFYLCRIKKLRKVARARYEVAP